MGKLLNDHSVEDLTLSDVLAGGVFDHVRSQHTGEFDKKKKKNVLKMFGRWWAVLELNGIKHNENSFYITDEVCVI